MELTNGVWRLELDPVRGGMIRALDRSGVPVLRPMPPASSAPFDSACFPLAPYVNRIAGGRFTWDGKDHHLPANHPEQVHPLHGTAWLGAWTVTSVASSAIELRHEHVAGPDWPWSFALTQRLTLHEDGLEAALEIVNTDYRAMPAALGFHPWFARRNVREIAFKSEGMWLADSQMLPTRPAPADTLGDWARGAGLTRDDLVDHCYTGWSGSVQIGYDREAAQTDLVLEGDGTPFLHLYVPPGRDFFCAEPQTTMPDAANREPPAPLSPGQSRSIVMRIREA